MFYSLKISIFPKCEIMTEEVTESKLKLISEAKELEVMDYKIDTTDFLNNPAIKSTLSLLGLQLSNEVNYFEVCSDFTHNVQEKLDNNNVTLQKYIARFLIKRINKHLDNGDRVVLAYGVVTDRNIISGKQN